MPGELETNQIKSWRSIVTLIVFVCTNLVVLFPFHIPIYVPTQLVDGFWNVLVWLRITAPRHAASSHDAGSTQGRKRPPFVPLKIPMNFVTAPLTADLLLLAMTVIGRREVHDGTIGADDIYPVYTMLFFLSLAYIAISIDASGLIRYLAFRVLKWGGNVGHRLFFYLYAFFFALSTCVGNDPVILSGTAFLAYMTRVSQNIEHPRAWIYSQFAVANIASAILVSSNPTNLVLAGAFSIKFINYTANMVVPTVVTGIVLFPFLLYIIFNNEKLIPSEITMYELPEEAKQKQPINPNIPNARGTAKELETEQAINETQLLSLEEIMNPFLDKKGAAFGAVIMATTLIVLLAVNAASQDGVSHQAFWVTLPAAVIQLCWDLALGWRDRHKTRELARLGRQEIEEARALRERPPVEKAETSEKPTIVADDTDPNELPTPRIMVTGNSRAPSPEHTTAGAEDAVRKSEEKHEEIVSASPGSPSPGVSTESSWSPNASPEPNDNQTRQKSPHKTLVSLCLDLFSWSQETFPTATVVMTHLPFALVPFALAMFVLVQALVTKGWVAVFAHGWDHWVKKTGTIGSIGGMGFLSVILCNFAGTNIGTTILLSRVVQAWKEIHAVNGTAISDRTFWATVYSMALGVNYGAFSAAFSAALAGLLWRDILARKHIRVGALDFAYVNLPIITISMIIGCAVLVGQIYITRDDRPYDE